MSVHIGSFLDLDNLERRIRDGFIARKQHPSCDLVILNYTAAAQWQPGMMLDNEVRHSRGLIHDRDGMVVARPFAKFHNLHEHTPVTPEEAAERAKQGLPPRTVPPALPATEPFEVFEKLDGSLAVLYPEGDRWAIATRGSFVSTQAQWATRHLRDNYSSFVPPEGVTLLFEAIFDSNRIVVKYPFEGLVLLAAIDNATGADVELPTNWDGPVVRRLPFQSFDEVAAMAGTDPDGSSNSEGFVIRFQSGARCKVKFAEYCRLHRILTGVSNKTVYEHLGIQALRDHFDDKVIGYALGMAASEVAQIREVADPLAELVDNVPDEFADWLRATILDFETSFAAVLSENESIFAKLPRSEDRREMAAIIKAAGGNSSVLFRLLDGRLADDIIWKQIRPSYSKAFTVDPD